MLGMQLSSRKEEVRNKEMDSRRLEIIAGHLCASPASARVNQGHPVIIGAMVMDVHAIPDSSSDLRRGTTTPGQIKYHHGGVARNVAECMFRLNCVPFLISVVGQDMAGDNLVAHLESLGLPVDGICRLAEATTPVVSAVFDTQRELAAAVADVQTIERHLTVRLIRRFANRIRNAPIVMLDANLLPESLEGACKLAHDANVPVWFEPVSVSKAVRANNILKFVTYISPNEAEIVAIDAALSSKAASSCWRQSSQAVLTDDLDVENVIRQLGKSVESVLAAGVQYVVLTLGHRGAVVCSSTTPKDRQNPSVVCHHYPALPASIVSLSGAGDCLVAGALSALLKPSTSVGAAVCYGMAAAKAAVESDRNVPTRFHLPTVEANAGYCQQSGHLLTL